MASGTDRKRAHALAWYLGALGLALALPLLIYAAVLTVQYGESERARLKQAAQETTRSLLVAFEREIAAHVAALKVLSTSSSIWEKEGLSEFYMEALTLAHIQKSNVVLRSLDGKQIINTRVPWGTMLPTQPLPEVDGAILDTKAPHVSDLVFGAITGEPFIVVTVPVICGGEVVRLLSANIPIGRLRKLVDWHGIAEPYIGSISDRNGTILARSIDPGGSFGRTLPGFSELTGQEGIWSGANLTGTPVLGFYQRSPLTGFVSGVGVPTAAMEAPLRSSLTRLGIFGALLAVAGLVLALLITRRMAHTARDLAAMAHGLGRGEHLAPPHFPIREANSIADALATAAAGLHQRDAKLERANRELERRVEERTCELAAKTALLEATLDNMDQGLAMVGPDGRVAVHNRRILELLDLPPELMADNPSFAAVREYQIAQGEFANAEPKLRRWVEASGIEETHHAYERERPNGTVLEIRTVPLAGGGIVRTYTDITGRKDAERKIERMARRDPLTELPNRTLFRERLEQELARIRRGGGALNVLCLDLDRFKVVNDTLGHPVGDALLREVANRIQAALRTEDTVARLGGDEFAVIQVANAAREDGAAVLAGRLIETLGEPLLLEGQQIAIGASIGVARAPQDGLDPDLLFKKADLALYRAKNEGRNTHRLYEPGMDAALEQRRRLELDLRGALARDEFELHYQPILSVASGLVTGFEALLRWRHPARGLVPPALFIEVAEETGLIVPIGEWALREACLQAATWPRGLKVAVNISAVQFRLAGLLQSTVAALAASRLPANCLELEITETVLMAESEGVLRSLHALRELGVRIALDDFGTGYSSLSYLRTFPFDNIKIDRSFIENIADPDTAAIVRAIVGLGSRLGTAVTAEGIETQEQFERVRAEGCTEVQGYLFSPPRGADEARALIAEKSGLAA